MEGVEQVRIQGIFWVQPRQWTSVTYHCQRPPQPVGLALDLANESATITSDAKDVDDGCRVWEGRAPEARLLHRHTFIAAAQQSGH